MSEAKKDKAPEETWVEKVITFKNAVIAFAIIEAIVILLVIYYKLSR
jgi:hypothetical protein